VPAASLLADIEERFRRLLLQRLNRAERLSEAFLNNLLGWNPSGFSVDANQLVFDDEPDRLERLARYLTRAPIAVDAVRTDDRRGNDAPSVRHRRHRFTTRPSRLDSCHLPTDYPGGSSFEVIPGHLLPSKQPECGRFPTAANT